MPYADGFFGSGVLWMLLTFPAYWVFQWLVEGEPFYLSRRPELSPVEIAEPATAAITE